MNELPRSKKEILLWVMRLRKRQRVTGASMLPGLRAGDEVLLNPRATRPRVGDIVVARDPRQPARKIIKRVTAVDNNGWIELSGDNASASTDSRTFGLVSPDLIVGRVTSRFF
jgi:nickel-type superoxide dismutase maturation protease